MASLNKKEARKRWAAWAVRLAAAAAAKQALVDARYSAGQLSQLQRMATHQGRVHQRTIQDMGGRLRGMERRLAASERRVAASEALLGAVSWMVGSQ